jgi:ribonuclease BN (tRNA processing enzyme)
MTSMTIRCRGARGSIPVSGKEYLKYGGDTTCLEIRTGEGRLIIVDAGTGIRRLGGDLISDGLFSYDMIFTHAHWDHLMGFPFFMPLYHPETTIRMLGCPFAQQFVETMLGKIMSTPNFPVDYADIKARVIYTPECPHRLEIGSTVITPIPLSHSNQGNGYKFVENGKTFVFLTDNELDFHHDGGRSFQDYVEFASNADLLLHDAEYDETDYLKTKGWGHSVYTTALSLAIKAGVKRFGLFHHNQWKTDSRIDQMVGNCRDIIEKHKIEMECFAVEADMILSL